MIELYIRKYYRLKEFKKSTTEDSATAFMRFFVQNKQRHWFKFEYNVKIVQKQSKICNIIKK